MDFIERMEKLRVNLTREAMFDPSIVLDMLDDASNDWRVIWEELPTDQVFDQLYAVSGKYQAFIYQGALFERVAQDPDNYRWDPCDGSIVGEWILDNPPFECCVTVADLYRYAANLKESYSPWLLFLTMTGYQEDGEVSLPISGSDATFLGHALAAWGEYADVIDPYVRLILHYSE